MNFCYFIIFSHDLYNLGVIYILLNFFDLLANFTPKITNQKKKKKKIEWGKSNIPHLFL